MPAGRDWPLILGILANLAAGSLADEPRRPAERAQPPPRPRVFRIQVVDEQTGRGVPLVELKMVNQVRYVTDSNGIVAFDEPGLFNRKVFFSISSHGYEAAKDNFGYRGRALEVTEGGSARIAIHRRNLAQRLYRVTGAGIYRDSTLTGDPIPIREPLLNGRVFGQDSVVNVEYQGKIYWFWGDTNRPDYPLGNFHVPGATSELPGRGGLDPDVGVNLNYFLDEQGFARPTAPLPGEGPTWISGLVVLHDRDGKPRMFASYVKVRNLLQVYQHGLVEFRPETRRFEKVAQFPAPPAYPGDYPSGHPFLYRDKGVEYVYYANPYPLIRVPADPDRLADPAAFESYTCLKRGTTRGQQQLDRGSGPAVRYGWKHHTQVLPQDEQNKLITAGRMKPEEALLNLRDIETGKTVLAHGGSVYWNAYRGRWVMIAVESFGSTSFLGEVWFAEADTPLGPWVFARKIVSHEKYSFYNPKQHPMFDKENGRIIYFEGTYTATFSGNTDPTPRYDYNQVMYRLDLSDRRLALPVAIYEVSSEGGGVRLSPKAGPPPPIEAGPRHVAFFAPDRAGIATLPVYERPDPRGGQTLRVGNGASSEERPAPRPLFYVLPAKGPELGAATVPLYEYQEGTSERRIYSVRRPSGDARNVKVLGRVWRNPARLRLW
ncbi:MAG TPA: hypothetical protein VFF52_30805 [Isosphaeraceae bacterium]|nr:hypothetical protein [Isosphaeraceae bacterium]